MLSRESEHRAEERLGVLVLSHRSAAPFDLGLLLRSHARLRRLALLIVCAWRLRDELERELGVRRRNVCPPPLRHAPRVRIEGARERIDRRQEAFLKPDEHELRREPNLLRGVDEGGFAPLPVAVQQI